MIALLPALARVLLLLIVAVTIAVVLTALLLAALPALLVLLIILVHDFAPCGRISAANQRAGTLARSVASNDARNNPLLCRFMLHQQRRNDMAETRETYDLIGSDKVEGTSVYGADGNKIGSIERVMIGKRSGKVDYAVLSFGGFLGIGDEHYPLPWASLKYNTELGGYQTHITEQQLKGAPKYANDDEWDWADPTRGRKVSDYYGANWAY